LSIKTNKQLNHRVRHPAPSLSQGDRLPLLPRSKSFSTRGLILAALSFAIPLFAAPPSDTPGVAWHGSAGITEDVGKIMGREDGSPKGAQPPGVRSARRHAVPGRTLAHNPNAPAVSQWPVPSSPDSGNPSPLVPQTVGTSFLGIQLSESGYIPPDSMGAVGPTQLLLIANGRVKVFNKDGSLGPLNTTTDNLFASVRSAGTSDPRARYDRLSQRWFITMIDVATDNRVLIAVSSGPTITGTSSFTFFQFQHDLVGPTPNWDTGGFADYDSLGVDRFALYIGINVFNSAGTALLGTTGFVVNKSNLFSGTLTVTAFRQLATSTGAGPFAPRGVSNDDPAATEGYFIGVDNATFSKLQVRRISNPGGTPAISANLSLTVPTTDYPISQVHRGNTLNNNLDALDDRLFGASIYKNKITGTSSLWTAHNIQVDTSGTASASGGRNGSRWYEIGTLTSTPTLLQAGTLFDSGASNPRGFWIPSVAASGQGHMALGCSYASLNDFAGIGTSGRLRTDALGSIQAPTLAVVSSTPYNLNGDANPHRWGDFSQVAVDPNDDMTMWTFQEYCNATNSWGVQAVQLAAPPPVTPTAAATNSLMQGQSSVNVTVTGASVSGSEFFDPGPDTGGPGYANHLAAVVNGGGVTVNSINFVNPTNLTLNLTVAPNATPGQRTVTVTNPDGQGATSASGILTIVATGPAANFGANVTSGFAPLSVSFTNLSFNAANYHWDFGDGHTSTATNPSNTYLVAGTYTVSLSADDGVTTNLLTRTNYILVTNLPPLNANFTAGPTNGAVPLTVSFTNLSTSATNYSWNFGDGNASSAVNPVNIYSNAGSYTVTLTAVGPAGTNTLARVAYVTATNAPPQIVTQPQDQTVGLGSNATFTVVATGTPPLTYQWRFNGTNISGAATSAYTKSNVQLSDAGPYSVVVSNPVTSVTSSNANLSLSLDLILVTGAAYTQNFDGMGANGTNAPTGWFVGTGTGPISSKTVLVGDGSSSTSGNYNFGSSGSSNRALGSLASASTQRDTEARFLNISGSSINSFTISYSGEEWRVGGPSSVTNVLTLQYSTDGTNFTSLGAQFNFSTPVPSGTAGSLDGNAAANRVTGIGGNYTPTASITNGQIFYLRWADADDPHLDNAMAVDDFVITFSLGSPPPPVVAAFSGSPTSGAAPLIVVFTNLSTGATNYGWTFGDGNSSAAANPSNIYSNAGTYTVSLTAIGPGGTNTLVQTNYVVVTNPPPPVVVAAFSGGPTSGVAPLSVAFTNLSSGATNYSWDFGDGNASAAANPGNTYSNAGNYTVSLTALGPGGTNILVQTNYVVVTNPPPPVVVAVFSGSPTSGIAPLMVVFTNLSSGATNYSWNFGDGNSSAASNPGNTYSNAGIYTVSLTAFGPGGTNILVQTNYVVVTNPPPAVVAGFSGGPTSGIAFLTVAFTNLSSGATSYSWDFGDGNTSAASNPGNTYSNAGIYTVSLTAIGPSGTNILVQTNYVVVTNLAPPVVVASFSGSPTSGVAPLSVAFTNLSSGATTYSWDFGDNNSSAATNPGNTYSNAGIYTISLTAVGPGGTNILVQTNYVVVTNLAPPVVVAGFSGSPTSGVAPLSVAFTNLSSGATNYSWDFGDGNTSTDNDPGNIYTNAGAYTVSLIAIGQAGTNLLVQTNYILVLGPPQLVVNPPGLDFGMVFTNTTAQASFVISNAGGVSLSGTATLALDPFAILNPAPVSNLGFTVPSLGSTNLAIGFSPTLSGVFSNVVEFASNGGAATNTVTGQGVQAPVLPAPVISGPDLAFTFATIAGKSYTIQYTDSLRTPAWLQLQTVTGDGTIKIVTTPVSLAAQRFFRLQVQ
jgi:PKD repeat protein